MKSTNTHRWAIPLATLAVASTVGILLGASQRVKAPTAPNARISAASPEEVGKYLVMIGGCNDCHTAGYAQKQGKILESEWLKGDSLGWKGPWGTSYAPNLRLSADRVTEDAWVAMCKNLNARPPMPNISLRSMSEPDLRALYQYIKGLPGDKGHNAPDALPPAAQPKGPVVIFPEPPEE